MKLREQKSSTKHEPGFLHADGMGTIEFEGNYYTSVNDIIKMLDALYRLADHPKAKIQIENLRAGFIGLRLKAGKVATKVVKE